MGTLNNRCVIIGGGETTTEFILENLKNDDFVICADSGYDYLVDTNIVPNLIIGDFDSIKNKSLSVDTITLPVEKDITDTQAAFEKGKAKGYSDFLLLGGTGGRFEHTFANIAVMASATCKGIGFEIIDEKHHFYCVHNSSISIKKGNNEQVSVFAFGCVAKGVSEKGMYYSLDNAELSPFDHIGISNHIVDDFGTISVENGTLIIIKTKM